MPGAAAKRDGREDIQQEAGSSSCLLEVASAEETAAEGLSLCWVQLQSIIAMVSAERERRHFMLVNY
jgi:hypothetical protein